MAALHPLWGAADHPWYERLAPQQPAPGYSRTRELEIARQCEFATHQQGLGQATAASALGCSADAAAEPL